MAYEYTFVIIKPGAVLRRQVGEIMSRYERAGMSIDVLRFSGPMPEVFWKEFYGDLHTRIPMEAYLNHIQYMAGGPVVPMTLVGRDVIERVRLLNGATNPLRAAPGTIRGDLGRELPDNVVHASDSQESVDREFKFWETFLEVR